MKISRLFYLVCRLVGLMLIARSALGSEVSFSGFGTIGYTQSDQAYSYQRFINNQGTFKRDSVLGMQADVKFNPTWGATVQAKVAPSLTDDSRWEPTLPWVFLSYRPNNDLLLRLGKLRAPFYLSNENMDVGATYNPLRQPLEVYSTSPTPDFNGASFTQSWGVNDEDNIDLDGYWGQSNIGWRLFDSTTGTASWNSYKLQAEGLKLSLHRDENNYHVGLNYIEVRPSEGYILPASFVLGGNSIPTVYGMANVLGNYYVPAGTDPSGAPVGMVDKARGLVKNIGIDHHFGSSYRVMLEWVRRATGASTDVGPDTTSSYVTLSKEVGHWTPYVTYAQLQSQNLALFQAVKGAQVTAANPLNPVDQGAASKVNANQRQLANSMSVYDQSSWTIGAAYSLTATSKIKAEWMSTHIGFASILVDASPGAVSNQDINVFSIAYSFVY